MGVGMKEIMSELPLPGSAQLGINMHSKVNVHSVFFISLNHFLSTLFFVP